MGSETNISHTGAGMQTLPGGPATWTLTNDLILRHAPGASL